MHGFVPWTAALAVMAWLLVGDPLLGRAAHRRFLRALDSGEPGVRGRFYLRWAAQGWALAAVVLALALGPIGWTLEHLGLRPPDMPPGLGAGPLGGVLVGGLVGIAVGIFVARRAKKSSRAKPAVAGGEQVARMLPQGAGERWRFAVLALTAGITEELVWRGFCAALLLAAFPHLPMAAEIVVLGLAFGWAHLYQGPSGMIATAVLGAILAGLYLATGSLLVPVVLHALIDLRVLLLPSSSASGESVGSAQRHDA